MENYIVLAVLALLIGLAVLFIVKEKKKGKKCIGCPYADQCGKPNGGCPSACGTKHRE